MNRKKKKKPAFPLVWSAWADIPHYELGKAPEEFIEQQPRMYRCCCAKRAMIASYDLEATSPRGDVEDAVTDLLSDLRHLCQQLGIDYAEHDRRAQQHFSEEQQQDEFEVVRVALYDNPETSCRERYQAGKLIGLVTAFSLPQEGQPIHAAPLNGAFLPALPFRSGQVIGDLMQLPAELLVRLGYNADGTPAIQEAKPCR